MADIYFITDRREGERGKKKLIIHRWNSFGEYHNSPTVISLLLGPGHKTKMKSAAHGSTERKEEEEAAGVWRRRITKISKCISSYKKKRRRNERSAAAQGTRKGAKRRKCSRCVHRHKSETSLSFPTVRLASGAPPKKLREREGSLWALNDPTVPVDAPWCSHFDSQSSHHLTNINVLLQVEMDQKTEADSHNFTAVWRPANERSSSLKVRSNWMKSNEQVRLSANYSKYSFPRGKTQSDDK